MRKLGYTWYPKDWGNSESVFELNLSERGLYREFIDLAMLNDNKTEVKKDVWIRKFAVTEIELNNILSKLEKLSLIEFKDDILFIPSCESRLNLSRGGREGGKNGKPNIKPTSKPFESLLENNEKPIVKQREKKIKDKEIYMSFLHLKISNIEFNKLLDLGYSKNQIDKVLEDIENYAPNKKYKSLYLTAKNWLEKEKPVETDPEKTIDFDAFLNYFKSVYKKCQLVNIPEATKKRFLELLQCGYTKNQLMFAIKNSYKDEYNRDKINIETFSFSGSLEKYLNFKEDRL